MITLSIDTSEARGSVAVLRAGTTVARRTHGDRTDYSAWLLPVVEAALAEANSRMGEVDLLAVATGPGSFTGLRIGLTTVKAWAEVFGKPIVGVSRLEAIARSQKTGIGLVASCYDAQRGQMFGAIYRKSAGPMARLGAELVISPEEFVQLVDGQAGGEPVTWISLDPKLFDDVETFQQRIKNDDSLVVCTTELASSIGLLAEERAGNGQFSDPVTLDANYVRRSDAEIFWKGSSAVVR
jgi:tRNA threonylcarbamoyladenosine biosynthesis protein TsaB